MRFIMKIKNLLLKIFVFQIFSLVPLLSISPANMLTGLGMQLEVSDAQGAQQFFEAKPLLNAFMSAVVIEFYNQNELFVGTALARLRLINLILHVQMLENDSRFKESLSRHHNEKDKIVTFFIDKFKKNLPAILKLMLDLDSTEENLKNIVEKPFNEFISISRVAEC